MDRENRKWLLIGCCGLLLLPFLLWPVFTILMRNAKDTARQQATLFYEREIKSGDGLVAIGANQYVIEGYRDHLSKAGKVKSFSFVRCYAQVFGTPAGCEMFVTREHGKFMEIFSFHHTTCTTFGALPAK